jgi:hypothetical protein
MPVHSLHVFDRRGKTLFTKQYIKGKDAQDLETLSEQRKLVFGMLYSLRETADALTPEGRSTDLHLVRTGASTLYTYETKSEMRFAMYVADDNASNAASIRQALSHVYNELWILYVIRSPLYRPKEPNVQETNFEGKLDAFFGQQPWFR